MSPRRSLCVSITRPSSPANLDHWKCHQYLMSMLVALRIRSRQTNHTCLVVLPKIDWTNSASSVQWQMSLVAIRDWLLYLPVNCVFHKEHHLRMRRIMPEISVKQSNDDHRSMGTSRDDVAQNCHLLANQLSQRRRRRFGGPRRRKMKRRGRWWEREISPVGRST